MAGEEQKCLNAGCDGYLTKPVNRSDLIAYLSRLSWSGLGQIVAQSPLHSIALDVSDDSALVSQLDLDDPELKDIVDDFVLKLDHYLSEILSAYAALDWALLCRHGHSLKGTAAMTGFGQLSKFATAFEDAAKRQNARDCDTSLKSMRAMIAGIQAASSRVVGSAS